MINQQSGHDNYIVIDQGNTLIKVILFYDNEIRWLKVFKQIGIADRDKIRQEFDNVQYGIISSVASEPEVITALFPEIKWIILSHETPVPVINQYKTPATLGKDRLAAVVAASDLYQGKDILVIDTGTAITYDLVTKDKKYSGGSISPGLSLRFKALNAFTGRLPLLEASEFNGLTGVDTNESILSGVMNGALFEITGFINNYKENYPELIIILTGGDSDYFDKNVKSDIFVVPNLVAYGLKLILQYNLEK
ncbi:MAG TPA: type III pantothenate kinase [Lentimicrobium sp.]|nr:type III pantothenate kinase [Lentimicrobium sp.]